MEIQIHDLVIYGLKGSDELRAVKADTLLNHLRHSYFSIAQQRFPNADINICIQAVGTVEDSFAREITFEIYDGEIPIKNLNDLKVALEEMRKIIEEGLDAIT
jgi:hypothetical protein